MVLNPNAAPFYPASQQQSASQIDEGAYQDCWAYAEYYDYDYEYSDNEDEVTDEQLEELEAVDAWLDMMVDLEESETEHLIAYALQHAPAAAQVIEEQVLGHAEEGSKKPKHRKGHKSSKSE